MEASKLEGLVEYLIGVLVAALVCAFAMLAGFLLEKIGGYRIINQPAHGELPLSTIQ